MTIAIGGGLSCPMPPANFSERPLPLCELNLSASALYRIHRTSYGPMFFNRRSTSSTVFRFDAPEDEYGVLYASQSFEACMAETVIRDRFEDGAWPLVVDHSELASRSVSSLGLSVPRALRLANLASPLLVWGLQRKYCPIPIIGCQTCGVGRFINTRRRLTVFSSALDLPMDFAWQSLTASSW